jgi:hypothetical protein
MEPLHDRELNELLREWKAPDAPGRLRPPRRPSAEPWWRWLVTGTIRVPVPVGLAAALLAALWVYTGSNREPAAGVPAVVREEPAVSLADFQPVEVVQLRVVGEMK